MTLNSVSDAICISLYVAKLRHFIGIFNRNYIPMFCHELLDY